MIRVVIVLAVAMAVNVAPCLLYRQLVAADPPASDAELQKMLADTCRKHKVPSLTIAVVRANELLTTQCSGIRKRGTDDAVALTDRHPIGSCTKSMTATLAAVLVEAGKIKWDTTIGEVWPQAGEKHLHPALREVTLDELLAHQGGLVSDIEGKDWTSFFREQAKPLLERKRMLGLVLAQKPAHPRGSYHYANLGYVIAAAMLEARGGTSYETLMQDHVFKPLGMKSAEFRTLALAKKLKPPLLWGHLADGTPIDPRVAGAENPAVYASCGTVNLSIADYARYAQWHLRSQPAPLLTTPEPLDHLHQGRVDATDTGGKYGCGWIVLNAGLGRALTHAGSNTNSQAVIWLLPDRDFGAVACTNTGENAGFLACDAAIQQLMQRYAGLPSKN